MSAFARATWTIALAGVALLGDAPTARTQSPLRGGKKAQQGDEQATQRLLFQLENDWAQAVIRRDSAALRTLTAPRWVYSDESGVMEREAGIRAFTTGTDTVHEASNSGMRAFIYPGAAVVIGVLHMKGRGPAGPFSRSYRYTDTWLRIDGRWRCIASQDYLIPGRPRAR